MPCKKCGMQYSSYCVDCVYVKTGLIQSELTDKQRMCLLLHYYEGIKMKDIALKLGLCNSTVSRHIASATKKLKNIAQYYM